MAERAVFLVVVLLVSAASIRFGMLIGKRLDTVVNRDDEEPRDPAS